MEIVPAPDLDPDGLAAALAVQQRDELAADPGLPPTTPAEFEALVHHDRSGGNVHERRAVVDDGRVRVLGHLELVSHDANLHLAETELFGAAADVEAGRVAVAATLDRCAADGRTTLLGWGPLTGDEDRFWTGLGARLAYVEQVSMLDVPGVDPELMQAWIDRRAERAADVQLVQWTGLCPEEYVDAYAVSRTAMNDAPVGELELHDEIKTADGIMASDAGRLALGYEIHTLFAVDPDGAAVGHTAVQVNPYRPAASWQWDTVVLARHRQRGIGRWIKAAMWQYLREAAPEATRLRTGNAVDNDPMLSINRAMGFVPTNRSGGWQADLDTYRRALAV